MIVISESIRPVLFSQFVGIISRKVSAPLCHHVAGFCLLHGRNFAAPFAHERVASVGQGQPAQFLKGIHKSPRTIDRSFFCLSPFVAPVLSCHALKQRNQIVCLNDGHVNPST